MCVFVLCVCEGVCVCVCVFVCVLGRGHVCEYSKKVGSIGVHVSARASEADRWHRAPLVERSHFILGPRQPLLLL